MPLISIENVKKEYQVGRTRVAALNGVNLAVERGEFTVVTGPSGSGKSTLLNVIGCLDRPSSGRYVLDGEAVEGRDFDALADVRNRKIGFIFQSFNLIPVLSVVENVEFPCVVGRRREPPSELRRRVAALIEEVGLTEHMGRRPDELSGGQCQRVAIARALITNPDLVLADEPTANLDSLTAAQIVDLMQRLNREKGTTFLFSTHDARITAHARRVVEMKDGRVVSGSATPLTGS
jgi:putative ABC transport system ATP-binding protein